MIYCDKCKKAGVIDRVKELPKIDHYTMEDIVLGKNEDSGWVTADVKWQTRILECPTCDYSREYQSGSGGLRPTIINLDK